MAKPEKHHLKDLLQGAGQLTHLASPRAIVEVLVERVQQWTGRQCACRVGRIQVGDLTGRVIPFAGGEFFLDPADLDLAEEEAIRLWLVLGAGALERCQTRADLCQHNKLAALGQLAAGVAHEVNTPLGAISMALGLAKRSLPQNPEKVAERLDMAVKSLEQVRVIVSKLLSYSRNSDGERRRTNLGEVVYDAVQLVGQSFQLDSVALEFLEQPTDCWVEANAGEIQQVLINLLGNARLAVVGRPDALVRVSLGPGRATVEDNGPGVNEDDVQHIFEPFFTTREAGQGVGLGLSISREIISRHQGELRYGPSKLGGACFEVRLPEAGQ